MISDSFYSPWAACCPWRKWPRIWPSRSFKRSPGCHKKLFGNGREKSGQIYRQMFWPSLGYRSRIYWVAYIIQKFRITILFFNSLHNFITGHKNCKLFITHGGLNSLQEAVYHGVPVLGLPFGTDQKLNMRRAIDDGYATKLAWTEINQESLTSAIIDLLYNKNSNNVRYTNVVLLLLCNCK